MKLLLDTHVWVWASEDVRKLGPKTRKVLTDVSCARSVCAVSALELARLVWAGDLILQIPLDEWVEKSLADLRADSLPKTERL